MTLRPINVLLVEDDELDVMNIRRAFRNSKGVRSVTVARDGEEALHKLRGGEVPRERLLCLLDLNMPRMNGIEFLEAIRADEDLCRLPVVVLTTSSDARDRSAAYDHNVAGYMVKPVSRDSFLEGMRSLEDYWERVIFP